MEKDYLWSRLDYEPDTGLLRWKEMVTLSQQEVDVLNAYDLHKTYKAAAKALGIGIGKFQCILESGRKYRESGANLPLHTGKRLQSTLVGQIAGNINSDGYVRVGLNGKVYLAHRLIWCMMTGSFPDFDIDHKDLNTSNNRFDNLRACDRSQNNMNHPIRVDNSSGIKGIYFESKSKKWTAEIKSHGVRYWLGSYDTKEEAGEARRTAAQQVHKDFARAA